MSTIDAVGVSPPTVPPDPSTSGAVVVDGVTVVGWPGPSCPIEPGSGQPDPTTAEPDPVGALIVVVADDAPPPVAWPDGHDWIRPSAAPAEVRARTARTAGAARRSDPWTDPAPVVLDTDGVLRAGADRWVVIPPVEARILTLLLARTDHVVARERLFRAGWPSGCVNHRALDGRIKLLRRRITGLGLTIHTVRGVGYLLEVTPG